MTLRITRKKESRSRVTLRLEGNLVAQWATLLEEECSGHLSGSAAVSLDLTAVRFVDQAGLGTLERLSRAGVEIRCSPGVVASVLEGEGIHVSGVGEDEDRGRVQRPARNQSGGEEKK